LKKSKKKNFFGNKIKFGKSGLFPIFDLLENSENFVLPKFQKKNLA